MRAMLAGLCLTVALLGITVILVADVDSQEPPPAVVGPPPTPVSDVPKGVDVMARGPVHEAYAAPNVEPKATVLIPRKPPAPMEEMPPEDRPDGDVVWVGGYWNYDDDRKDFLWVSGCWRVKPEHKEWVPGYWREVGDQWQWVAGFWSSVIAATATTPARAQEVTYYPQPPAPPNLAPVGPPAEPDLFYVPGYYQWNGSYYVWRAGYWSRVRAGYIYVPSHYQWTPTGYVFVPGYWDYTIARRGVVYAPVVIDTAVVPATYVYSPAYAVHDVLIVDAMFVQPGYAHYYFGDYYGPVYANRGYVTTVVYSRSYYEPVVVYQRYEYRDNPRWFDVQINLVFDRNAGRAPLPPRTLVEQQTVINNMTVNHTTVVNNYFTQINNNYKMNVQKTGLLAPSRTMMAARGIPATRLDAATRVQVKQTSQAVAHAAATERRKTELAPVAPGTQGKPRTAAYSVPHTPVAPKGQVSSGTGHPNGAPALGAHTQQTTHTQQGTVNSATGQTHSNQSGTSSTKGTPAGPMPGAYKDAKTGTTTGQGSGQPPGQSGAFTNPGQSGSTGTPARPMPPAKKDDSKKKDKQ
jgi:hypothetical protein